MKNNSAQEKILIIDFGSQYTQLIARRIRELGVYCELHLPAITETEIKEFAPQGIILSGGPESVTDGESPKIPNAIWEAQCPILGICYGMQAMAKHFSGKVAAAETREFGSAKCNVDASSALFQRCEFADAKQASMAVWMSHGDHVSECPDGFKIIAASADAEIAAMANESKQLYAVQFHPEVTHSVQGEAILSAFAHDICGCGNQWQKESIVDSAVADVRKQVGDEKVLLGLSGGVDSSVVAALLHRAIGEQLTCVFVNTGLLRLGEAEEVEAIFSKRQGVNLVVVDASAEFLSALAGVEDPERKRKICGELFVRVFEREAAKIKNCKWLAQGTIYPDVIESAKAQSGAHVIKSHHNVGGLPEEMNLKLLEPLRDLFKDEVRVIGEHLGLPHELVWRHPFPGPGLALRVLGEVTESALETLRQADHIFLSALRDADLYHSVSQAFAVFLPVKSVGVKGDARCYAHVVALRAVQTIDFMTAHWAPLPNDFLSDVSHKIINNIDDISRVVYDISGKPPATIEWE